MFTTGTLDKYNQNDEMRVYYEQSKALPKVYVNLMDAYHMEVQEGMRLNVLTAQFLSCQVSQKEEDCDVIYGTGPDSICEVNEYYHCMVTPDQGTPIYIRSTFTITTTTKGPSSCLELDKDQGTWCIPSSDATPKVVQDARDYVCGKLENGCDDCSTDAQIFNAYYQSHLDQGSGACAFNGAGQLMQPTGSVCLPKDTQMYLCQVAENATDDSLTKALMDICAKEDCTPINPGGKCVYSPDEALRKRASWAFNTWYTAHVVADGSNACDFDGAAELVTPVDPPPVSSVSLVV